MMLRADLHMHTTASDGVLTPSQVVFCACEKGLNLIAVTDHDTLGGVAEAMTAAAGGGCRVIPAIELSAGEDREIHLLGYGVALRDQRLRALLDQKREERMARAKGICDRLRSLGMPLDGEIPVRKQGVPGRPQIARLMIEKGYVGSVAEAFEKWLGKGRPAYVARQPLRMEEAILLLRQMGAVPVLAHPAELKMDPAAAERYVKQWRDAGLLGMEVYHPSNRKTGFDVWRQMAERNGLLITGGSDFHESGDRHAEIGEMLEAWKACPRDCLKLLEALPAQGEKSKM